MTFGPSPVTRPQGHMNVNAKKATQVIITGQSAEGGKMSYNGHKVDDDAWGEGGTVMEK